MPRPAHHLGEDHASGWNVEHPVVATRTRRRVLVEVPDGAEAFARVSLFRRNGFDVTWCPGPDGEGPCPLVHDGFCPLVGWADVLVTCLELDDERSRDVLHAVEEARPDLPVVVETTRPLSEKWASILRATNVVTMPTTSERLLETVNRVAWRPSPMAAP